MPDITVHHLNLSRSTRVLWMLEELGLEYAITRYERDPKTLRAPPALAKVHPLGRSPVVEVDGRVLAESGAILEYFAEKHGALRPTDGDEVLQYRYFLHYAEGSVMSPLLVRLITDRIRSAPLPFFIRPIARRIADGVQENYSGPEIARHFAFIDQALADRPFFVGDSLTMADIQMSYPVEAGLARGAGSLPHARAWFVRMQGRPGYQRALQRGGPAVP